MTETRRVICWRHGRTAWNAEKRFQGQSDIPLDALGEAQAEHAARLLATLRPDVIVASDLRRAADTAAFLGGETGLEVEFDKRLRERSGGEWEGLTAAEIRQRWPERHAGMDIPGGELMADVGERVTEAVERALVAVPEHGLLVIVSHGAAIRAGISRMLGLPQEQREVLGPLGNCSWSLIGPMRSGGWRLLEHNAASLPEEIVLGDDQ
ncbi:histidine phosphatase family protein [Halostreptopolyspora alba]|uniref:Histidine phosphatase family protein n=1 Tax=Halostreptopolyspora alba TaxID=2487137 RepID=A0A3N0EHI9_9ACTN|nr:histidine phosphatase family protein [Nocardiopsaceae bacterium YIM 96095]